MKSVRKCPKCKDDLFYWVDDSYVCLNKECFYYIENHHTFHFNKDFYDEFKYPPKDMKRAKSIDRVIFSDKINKGSNYENTHKNHT